MIGWFHANFLTEPTGGHERPTDVSEKKRLLQLRLRQSDQGDDADGRRSSSIEARRFDDDANDGHFRHARLFHEARHPQAV